MTLTPQRILLTALAAAVALTAALDPAGPAMAQQYTVAGAPGVANVSLTQGEVVIVRGDSGEQVTATINAPLLPGDYLSTAGGSRAEVQFDGISMLRLAQNTQVRFVSLDPGSRELQVAAGTAELAELQGAGGSPQIDTPSVTVRPRQAGDYRVSVLSDGQTEVTVRSGSATVASAGGTQTVTPGTTLVASGPYSNPAISLRGAIAYDAFDTFNSNRDNATVAAYNANQYVAPQLAGYANFANYGSWNNVPGYGQSWAPSNQTNNWTPYSNGQWTWEPGYGYTWVGNEPWGYAPYHYGRWFNYNNRWMWQPPAYQYQTNGNSLASSWLPALVGFFLNGGNGAIGAPGYNGNIGWVPLAPGEQYNPWYPGFGQNPGYGGYGVSNVTNVYNVYRNYRYVRIVRVYPIDRFRNGQWGRPILMHPDQIKRVSIVRGAVPIVPTRVLMRTGPIAVTRPIRLSPQFQQQRFAARRAATAGLTFAKSQAAIQSIASKPPKIIAAPAHPPAIKAPVYNPPAKHTTYRVPVMKAPNPKSAQPVHPTNPGPIHTMKPAPNHTMKPAPERTVKPEPIRTMRPAPVHTAIPVRAPAPVHTMRPEPVRTMQPQPIRTMRPEPVHTIQPAPVHQQPAPMRTMHPVATMHPVRTMAPAPYHAAPAPKPPKYESQPQPPKARETNAPHSPPAATTKNPKSKETPAPPR